MINVGIAGIGFMGMIHYLAYEKVRGVRVAAIATRKRKKRDGDWRSIQGNFGPRGEKMDLGRIVRYRTTDELFADDRIDVVDLCLPTHLHSEIARKALGAGKHVFCEKPIALTTADAIRMVNVAKANNRLLMIGHVLPFLPEYSYVYKMITSGHYGRFLGGHFKRIISDPKWMKGYYDPQQIGGPALDLHVHDAHFIRLICGMPKSVCSVGRMRKDVAEYFSSQFRFPDRRLTVTVQSGVIHQQGRPFTHGFEVHLERATALFDFSVLGNHPTVSTPLSILDSRGQVQRPKLAGGDPTDAFCTEIREVVESIRRECVSPMLSADLARDAVILCHKQTNSVKTRRSVQI